MLRKHGTGHSGLTQSMASAGLTCKDYDKYIPEHGYASAPLPQRSVTKVAVNPL